MEECPVDVVFVVDEPNWSFLFNGMRRFVSDLVGRMDIDSGNTRVGVVTFGDNVENTINLDDYSTVASLQAAISSLGHTGGGSNTAAALQHVRTSVTGDRANVPNVVVLLTSERSDDIAAAEVRLQQCFYPNVTTLRSGLCSRNSVCLSSVTLVHPTQGFEAFGNISSPLCTLAIL